MPHLLTRGLLAAAAVAAAVLVGCTAPPPADLPPADDGGSATPRPVARASKARAATAAFDGLLARHADMSADECLARLGPAAPRADKLSFDPTTAKHFDLVCDKLKLTPAELDIFKSAGFVSVDMNLRHGFPSAYYHIYTLDLPVLVTADSILHAMHRSFDDVLIDLETTLFSRLIAHALWDAQTTLAKRYTAATAPDSARDVDLYLTVAANLLCGDPHHNEEDWRDRVQAKSAFGQEAAALAVLKDIRSRKLQMPGTDSPHPTKIYGGSRFVDYSQFAARGHYTKSPELGRYFRAMMWLGRADCGWYVTPTDGTPGVVADSDRELRNAVLFCELLRDGGGVGRVKAVDDIVGFLVGGGDNLGVFALLDLMAKANVKGLADADGAALARLRDGFKDGARQAIRSQVVLSDPKDTYKVPPPALFQVFGQRFAVDSFVLSQVVFDSIIYRNEKQRRLLPSGLDVMAALGNPDAVPLLEPELRKWNYAANLTAAREYVDALPPAAWTENLPAVWLDSLRTLHAAPPAGKHFPEAMKTTAWRRKQLQAQLGSWAELRHDTVLYAKQAYTAGASCEYPAGYVEPYPEFYAKVRAFAAEAARRIAAIDFAAAGYPVDAQGWTKTGFHRDRPVKFFRQFAETAGRLEALARKELDGQPFAADDTTFLKGCVVHAGGCVLEFDGWYHRLFYHADKSKEWDAVVVDVHTDPNTKTCVQVGVGDAMFGVVAVDSGGDRMAFVGPLYSYYEFPHPAEDRLTDERWQKMIADGKAPPRPDWVKPFQAPTRPAARK